MSDCSEMSFFNNIKMGGFATKKKNADKILTFHRSHYGPQQWKGIHTAEQAVKGPEKYKMCQKSTWQH